MLRKMLGDVTQHAKQSQALNQITVNCEMLSATSTTLGIPFILWVMDVEQNKPKPMKTTLETSRDCFAKENLEQDLLVTQLYGTHNLVLNKFSIVDGHMVLPTIEFAPQEQPLDIADFRAMWTAMQGLDAFAFFNCGLESGASQPHKHMQLMTYSSLKKITGLDMPPLLQFIDQKLRDYQTTEIIQLPELPFCHYLHRIDLAGGIDNEKAAAHIVVIYDKILHQMNSMKYNRTSVQERTSSTSSLLPVAYNLLLTSSFMFIIPRKAPGFHDIEVNSIGFIGSFLLRNNEQRILLEKYDGPMELLRSVTFFSTLANKTFVKK